MRKIRTEQKDCKVCNRCGKSYLIDFFCKTNSPFYENKRIPFCNNCIEDYLKKNKFDWNAVDRLCQFINIPFSPKVFEDLHEKNGNKVFPIYVEFCIENEYDKFGWDEYYKQYLILKEQNQLDEQLPLLGEEKLKKLQEKWGHNYVQEELEYLEQLHNGLLATQNITGALQDDQSLKLCKMSLEIDNRIRDGVDFDKMLSSYDKLVRIADFTPKNVKSATDLESVGELYKWLEKAGWRCKFYDNVTRDIVDETIKNIQSFNQRLYIDEGGIGDEITRRIEALKNVNEAEKFYDVQPDFDSDVYDTNGYEQLILDEEGDFKVGDEE